MQCLIIGHLTELIFIQLEKCKNKPKELAPPPNNKPLPKHINNIAIQRILVTGCKQRNDPRHNKAFRYNGLFLEMLADLRVEYSQQSLELVHAHLEDLELVGEELLETDLHQVLEDTV
jgi:hypothetical protein